MRSAGTATVVVSTVRKVRTLCGATCTNCTGREARTIAKKEAPAPAEERTLRLRRVVTEDAQQDSYVRVT